MAFREIEGQEQAIEFFRNSVKRNRVGQAYLFIGPSGVGKTLMARNLAKFLNCERPLKQADLDIDCCDQCISCKKIDGLNHPDVFWIEANKSNRISIDEIRTLQKEAALKPFEGRYKVFIILQAQYLSEQAANSLLKILEEPPGVSLIILTATDTRQLLETIISRCQIVKFSLIGQQRLRHILAERFKLSAADAHFFSAQSEGRIGQALNLKEQDALSAKSRLIEQIDRFTDRDSAEELFNFKDKQDLARRLNFILKWYRDILVWKIGLPESELINVDSLERIKLQAGLFNIEQLDSIITKVNQAYRLIEQNINPKVVLQVMLGEIVRCKKLS